MLCHGYKRKFSWNRGKDYSETLNENICNQAHALGGIAIKFNKINYALLDYVDRMSGRVEPKLG